LEGEIMTSSIAAVAAASTTVLLEVGFGCCDGFYPSINKTEGKVVYAIF
jgi:hypothetical protein